MSRLTFNALVLAAFILIFPIHNQAPAHGISSDTTDIVPTKLKDVFGRDLSQAATGSAATLEVSIENNEDKIHEFVLLVEIRDTSGMTVFHTWQSGTLSPMGQSKVGVTWTPDNMGSYEVRSFAISDFHDIEILSEVQSSEVKVGDSIEYQSPPLTDDEEQESPAQQDSTLAAVREHALKRINEDRIEFGLEPVELSDNKAAQIHAKDVLQTKILSHWMTNGEKPYMTYTRYGGVGAVGQNVGISGDMAYYENCSSGNYYCEKIDPYKEIDSHEYLMINEDEVCCDNGHRDNILDPHHTHVSIGIAYDDLIFVIVQNFEDNYISFERSITSDGRNVLLKGTIPPETTFSGVTIGYDETPTSSVYDKNRDNGFYDPGELVAGVTDGKSYYNGMETITADRWIVKGNKIDIAFDLQPVMDKHGVYTIWAYLEDKDGKPFPVTSYSVVS